MTTIYGLREIGSLEIRYVGFTNYDLAVRLRKHQTNVRQNYPVAISDWIRAAGAIEIVALTECAADDARKIERAMVEAFAAAGHRLANGHLMPRLKIVADRESRAA